VETISAVRSVREQITDRIRDYLLCGQIPAGERLSEAKLAENFGVSRGPIRESLVQLTSEGLLVSKPNCGVVVAPEPSGEIQEVIVPIRKSIEVYALKSIFDSLSSRDFRDWDELLHRLKLACRDADENLIVLCDIEFHRSILQRAGNADLLAVWQSILVRVRGHFQRAVHRYRGSLGEVYREHQELVEIFRTGDKEASLKALEEHIW